MLVWPKTFYTFGASLKTAAVEWKVRRKHGATAMQDRAFRTLVGQLGGATFWRDAGMEPRMDYAAFQARVPLHDHVRLAPAVERMKQGELNVLSPGRCALFVASAGTTTGEPKHLPLTGGMLAHFRNAWLETLLYFNVRVRHAGVFRGRHLFCGGSSAVTSIGHNHADAAFVTGLPGVFELSQPRWAEKHLYEPTPAVAQIADWSLKVDAIATNTCQRDISLVSGPPPAVLTFAERVRELSAKNGATLPTLQALWPNFECFVHRGMPIAPFYDQLRAVLGPAVRFHECYAAAEGIFAVQDSEPPAGLRLLSDAGIFFEFVPASAFDPSRLEQLGPKAVPLRDVQPETDYVLVVTTPAGLVRYVVGDIVRFTSTLPPRLVYVGRTQLRLDAFGASVAEKEVTDALVAVCRRRDWLITNFHVAPLFAATMTGQQRGRHEWWVELKPGTVATPTGPQIAAELDGELSRTNPSYAARRCNGTLDAPFVRLVMPGVFEHWLRFHHRWGGEHKVARCRNDRVIADELAQITNFARD